MRTKEEIAQADELVFNALSADTNRRAGLVLSLVRSSLPNGLAKTQFTERTIDQSLQRLKRQNRARFIGGKKSGWIRL